MKIVDSHPHIYSKKIDKFPSIKDPWQPGQPSSAEDLKKIMDENGVTKSVFIQTGTFYGFNNDYVIESANKFKSWATGVITLDPDNVSSINYLEKIVTSSNIKGLRGIKDSENRIKSNSVYKLWEKALELNIVVNCMVMDDINLAKEINQISKDLSPLKIVIDHCFMLNSVRKTEETLNALDFLSKNQNIFAKLTSGTHGSSRIFPHEDMYEPIRNVIHMFGSERCVWGSNFPNKLWSKGTNYQENLSFVSEKLGLSDFDKKNILSTVPLKLWFS
jgi:predicted TIM-barrel fold metal-dependent hydrolase